MNLTRADAKKILGRRSTPPVRKESEIQRAILDYLRLVPEVVAWRNNTGAMFGEHKGKRWAVRFGVKGLSDIIGWRSECLTHHADGPVGFTECRWPHPDHVRVARWLAIEVKRPGKTATPEQAAFLAAVRASGGIAFVATSVADVEARFPLSAATSADRSVTADSARQSSPETGGAVQ